MSIFSSAGVEMLLIVLLILGGISVLIIIGVILLIRELMSGLPGFYYFDPDDKTLSPDQQETALKYDSLSRMSSVIQDIDEDRKVKN